MGCCHFGINRWIERVPQKSESIGAREGIDQGQGADQKKIGRRLGEYKVNQKQT